MDIGEHLAEHAVLGTKTFKKASFGITLDGQGGVITTGLKGQITIPYAGTITGWEITSVNNTSGSIVIDLWKDTYANYPPTVADTITGSEKPTLSSATKNQDLSLTTWGTGTSVSANDVIFFNVDSATLVTLIQLTIFITKS